MKKILTLALSLFTLGAAHAAAPYWNVRPSTWTSPGGAVLDYPVYFKSGSPWYDVKALGAVGNGVADDTVALKAALALKGSIYIPPGVYLTTTSLQYDSNTYIHGAGRGVSIIKLKSGSTINGAHGIFEPVGTGVDPRVSSVTIAHLTVDGNRGNTSGTYEGIIMSGVSNGTLLDVEARGNTETGLNVDTRIDSPFASAALSQVIGCYASSNTADGIQIGKAIVSNSYAFDNDGNGIRMAGAGSTNGLPYYAIIKGNAAYGNGSGGIQIEEQVGGNIGPTLVEGNWVAYNGWGIGTNIKGTRILNNIVEHNGDGGTFTSYGIRVAQDDCSVVGNIIKNNNYNGIQIFNNRSNTEIASNRCLDDQTSKTQQYCVREESYSLGRANSIHDNFGFGNSSGTIDPNFYTRLDYSVRFNDDLGPGWTVVSDTWTYASSTTITVPTNATTRYAKGDKIRLVQSGTTKYFSVASVAATLLTVTGGTDYTVANAAIASPAVSRDASPVGFPDAFNYTPTYTGFSGSVSTNFAYFSLKGSMCDLYLDFSGTSSTDTITATAPVSHSGANGLDSPFIIFDNSSWQSALGPAQIGSSTTTVKFGKTMSTIAGAAYGGFTGSGSKGAKGYIRYRY